MAGSKLKRQQDVEAEASDNESGVSSSQSASHSGSEHEVASDDNEEGFAAEERPLKRRRTSGSPTLSLPSDDEEDTKEPEPRPVPLFQAASRIKKKAETSQPTIARHEQEDEPISATDALEAGLRSNNASTFASLGLAPWLVKSLSAMAITRPTAIQKSCIPEVLK
ncbi:putative RNA helicase, partial [Ascosphaera atra]